VIQHTQKLQFDRERTAALLEVAQTVSDVQNLMKLLPDIIERIAERLPANRILLYLLDIEGMRTERFVLGGRGKSLSEEITFRQLEEGLTGWVLREGKPAISPKDIADPRESELIQQTRRQQQVGAVIVVPLHFQGKIMGTLTALNLPDEPNFSEEDMEWLTAVADQLAVGVQNATLVQTLQESETRLSSIMQKLPLVLWVLDENGVFTFWEGQGMETLGVRREEVVGRSITEVFADVPQIIVDSQRTLVGESFTSTVLLGERVWEIRHEPLSEVWGKVTGALEVAVDVTERSQTEFVLRQRTVQLETLRQISLELTAELDLNALLQSIVLRAVQLLGGDAGALYLYRADEEVLELAIRQGEIEIPINEKLQRGEALAGHVWETGEAWTLQDYKRWQKHEPLNTVAFAALVAVPIQLGGEFLGVLNVGVHQGGGAFDADDKLLSLFATQVAVAIHNARLHEQIRGYATQLEQRVTERTQELVTANDRLQEMDRLKSKLIDDISHELRTPVTSISLYLDLLARGNEDRRPYYIEVLHKQKDRLMTLIEGIIKISRLRLMNSPTNFTAVSLNTIMYQSLETQVAHAQVAGLQLHFTPDANLPLARGDSQQLGDAIINIVANAILYTVSGHINIRTFADEEYVYLEVQDTGIGIPASELPYIFERFYRGEQVSQLNKPGIGLGLTIAKETILFHGGDIEVTSEPGVGSKFCLWLPISTE
jgi:PAS domain S-box-containing protein